MFAATFLRLRQITSKNSRNIRYHPFLSPKISTRLQIKLTPIASNRFLILTIGGKYGIKFSDKRTKTANAVFFWIKIRHGKLK
jgi:hypothetical protein